MALNPPCAPVKMGEGVQTPNGDARFEVSWNGTVNSAKFGMMPSYRSLLPSDEPLLWALFYYAISVPPGQPAPPRDIIHLPELSRYVRDWGGKPGDRGVLAEIDGLPVGAAWLRLWNGDDRGYGFVDERTPELSMAVFPDHRGRGIGTEMLQRLLAEADRRNTAISLSVSEYNPARRLYERAGFVPVETLEDAITMLRKPAFGEDAPAFTS